MDELPVPTWVVRLRERADAAPLHPRSRLYAGASGVAFGSIEALLAQRMADAGLPVRRIDAGWAIDAPLDAALDRIARWLAAQVPALRWRGELLPVVDAAGTLLAAVERAVVRVLGIATHAVHLVGEAADGRVWVQQRALDKAVDPGRWDTTMGGLMAAGETVATTLERETWEEAGLRLPQLERLTPLATLTVRRPVEDGYMVEHIHSFAACLADGIEPVNQDGEVQLFEALSRDALEARLRDGGFTIEAALVLLHWLDKP